MKRNRLVLSSVLLTLVTLISCQSGNAQTEEPTNVPSTSPSNSNNPAKQQDIIHFGSYQQDSNDKKAIEWIVLVRDHDRVLLLSRNLLSSRPWDVTGTNLTYDKSSIRQWLNGEFLSEAFSTTESENILLTNLDNSEQFGYGTPAGEHTTDKVFLLSINEFQAYVSGNPFATSAPTDIAKREGAYANTSGNAAWWLRSPGSRADSPAYLSSGGTLGVRSHVATENIIGIRPAVWVKTNLLNN